MKKDIIIPDASGVGIAMLPEANDKKQRIWVAYFINQRDTKLENVLIQVSAKGVVKGEEKKTALVRFFLNEVAPQSTKKIEMLLQQATKLENQYWVSFYDNGVLYDKKIKFAAGEITSKNMGPVEGFHQRAVFRT
jgi:hypothetical protein